MDQRVENVLSQDQLEENNEAVEQQHPEIE